MDVDSVANSSVPTFSCVSLYSSACGDDAGILDTDNSSVSCVEEESVCIPPQTPRRARGSAEFQASALITKSCCARRRVTCFKLLSQHCIESLQEKFYSLSEVEQVQKVLTYMNEHRRADGSVLYSVGGQEVCETAFRMAYGLRYNRFTAIKLKHSGGTILVEHGRVGRGRHGDSSIRAISWLRMFFDKVGDRMPMKNDLHLPSCLTKADVYALAFDDLSQGGLECCALATFYKIWTEEFPHVKIPKESRFSKCDVCAAIKEGRERTLNPAVRKWLECIMKKHIELEKREREKYAKHRNKAQKYPSKYLSVIIDGMDQEKTSLPHIISNPKSMAGSYMLETHVTGIRAHGRSTMMAIDCGQFPHDSNLTIEILLRLFADLQGQLPPVLYVQMDNTCRDNKNKYVLTFAAIMVELGIFQKVKLGFLPVGHTHEDIDQLFSCVSRRLKHCNALTIPDLANVIQASFTPHPSVSILESVVDAKGWMQSVIPSLHDHLKAHQFKFHRNEQGECRMYYKEWSFDDYWLPQGGLSMLPEDNPVPLQTPHALIPCFDADNLRKVEATLEKASAYLCKAGVREWWKDWIKNAKSMITPLDPKPLHESESWALFKLPVSYPKQIIQHGSNALETSDFSGIEMESPHKGLAAAHEFPCNIPDIGEIRSLWVGHKGVSDIAQMRAQEESESELATACRDLRRLASECLHAFELTGLSNSDHPQVRKVTDLCKVYAPQSSSKPPVSADKGCKISRLWKAESADTDSHATGGQQLAVSLLGEELVSKVTEKNRLPPDIYIGSSRATVHQNQDILQGLEVGMMVAARGDNNFPRIGKVAEIPADMTLKSAVVVVWYKQERARHKPRWMRFFTESTQSGKLAIQDIILYAFSLTNKGALKKKTREYLKENM